MEELPIETKLIEDKSGEMLITDRKKKLTNFLFGWVKDNYDKTFLWMFLAIILIRLYYFWMTKNQPLWWDEAEYMSYAKSFAGIGNYNFIFGGLRLPGFPLLVSVFYFIGIKNEFILKILLCFIPSLLLITFNYFLFCKIYSDKRIALISTGILALLWENLFFSNRFHPDNLALFSELIAIYFTFSFIKTEAGLFGVNKKFNLFFIAIFSFFSIFFRPGYVVFVPAILFFLIFLYWRKIFCKKNLFWISFTLIILSFSAFFFFKKFPGFLAPFFTGGTFGWNSLSVFYGFFQSTIGWLPSFFFYAFLIGIVLFLFQFFLYFPEIKLGKNRNQEIYSDIFNFLILASTLFFFIFLFKANTFEYRWFFPLLPGLFAFTSKGVISFSNLIGKAFNLKSLVVFLIILISLLGFYTQYVHSDFIIKNKLDSYKQVKDAGLWIKENLEIDSTILTESHPQIAYYSERKVVPISQFSNEENFSFFVQKNSNLFLMISTFQHHPDWAYSWPQKNENITKPLVAFFLDVEKKQPGVILYKIK